MERKSKRKWGRRERERERERESEREKKTGRGKKGNWEIFEVAFYLIK